MTDDEKWLEYERLKAIVVAKELLPEEYERRIDLILEYLEL